MDFETVACIRGNHCKVEIHTHSSEMNSVRASDAGGRWLVPLGGGAVRTQGARASGGRCPCSCPHAQGSHKQPGPPGRGPHSLSGLTSAAKIAL